MQQVKKSFFITPLGFSMHEGHARTTAPLRGIDLRNHPKLSKGIDFPEAEREGLGLAGVQPDRAETAKKNPGMPPRTFPVRGSQTNRFSATPTLSDFPLLTGEILRRAERRARKKAQHRERLKKLAAPFGLGQPPSDNHHRHGFGGRPKAKAQQEGNLWG